MNQRTFNLKNRHEFTFNNYVAPHNNPNILHPVYDFLTARENEYGNVLFLWGAEGTGKSHILQSITNYMSKIKHQVFYSCLKHTSIIKPDLFESLENFQIICLDDIHKILPLPLWQEAFYYCLELTETHNIKLVVSSSDNINQINTARAETYSRLAASFRYQLPKLEEPELFEALKKRAYYRQIPLSENVLNFIKIYFPRDSKSIFSLLDEIEEYSLVSKRPVSTKMLRELLHKIK